MMRLLPETVYKIEDLQDGIGTIARDEAGHAYDPAIKMRQAVLEVLRDALDEQSVAGPTADLAALREAASRYRAAEWRQRIEDAHPVTSPEHNANVEEWRAADAALAALLGESSPYRAISRPAVEWRIAKCPHCGEELSVAASRPAVGEEGLTVERLARALHDHLLGCHRDYRGDIDCLRWQWHAEAATRLRAALAATAEPSRENSDD